MIQDFVDKFMASKPAIRSAFAAKPPGSYDDVVAAVLLALNPDKDYSRPDPDKRHLIDDGSYQGTLVFVVPEIGYQPSDYWYVKVGYGSCSGCDTLEAIRGYSDEPPSESQLDDYMTLALHVVQGIKKMGDE